MAKLSQLMLECGAPSQTSFRNLIIDDLGEASATGIKLTDFQFTGIQWSPISVGTLTIDSDGDYAEESATSDLQKTGKNSSMADFCAGKVTLTKNVASPTTESYRLILKDGATEVVSNDATTGYFTFAAAGSDTITFQAYDISGIADASESDDLSVDAEYSGAFNGIFSVPTEATVTVTDQTTGGNSPSSFLPGTPILMATGNYELIENLTMGSVVKSGQLVGYPDTDNVAIYRSVSSSAMPELTIHDSTVSDIIYRLVDGYWLINNLIKVTPFHDFYVKDKNTNTYSWQKVADLEIGDFMINRFSEEIEITSMEWKSEFVMVVTMDVETVDTYFAHDILVYNAGL